MRPVLGVVLAGGGAASAARILAGAAFRAGHDVKQSEGQRGGAAASDVRYGDEVLSPSVAAGEADLAVALDDAALAAARAALRPGGVLIAPSLVPPGAVADGRGLRLALLGALSARLDLAEEDWAAALGEAAPEARREQDEAAFRLGRRLGREAATEGVP